MSRRQMEVIPRRLRELAKRHGAPLPNRYIPSAESGLGAEGVDYSLFPGDEFTDERGLRHLSPKRAAYLEREGTRFLRETEDE